MKEGGRNRGKIQATFARANNDAVAVKAEAEAESARINAELDKGAM